MRYLKVSKLKIIETWCGSNSKVVDGVLLCVCWCDMQFGDNDNIFIVSIWIIYWRICK